MGASWKQPGYVLRDRFRFDEVLGEGGFGITYKAFDLQKNQCVAVKELKDAVENSNLEALQYMIHFGKVPGLVQIHEIIKDENTCYIVMEYIFGRNGVELLKQSGRLTQPQVSCVMKPVITALQYLHTQGIVHRDISTDNIMIDQYGRGTLIDLGAVYKNTDGLEMPGMKAVKQGFSPVELYYKNASVGTWTDVYEVCATVYHLLTGTVPAPALKYSQGEVLLSLQEQKVLVSPELDEILKKGMIPDYKERLDDMKILLQALDVAPNMQQAPVAPMQENKAPYVAEDSMKTLDGRKTAQVNAKDIPVVTESQKGKKKRKLIALGIIGALVLVLGISVAIYVHINHQEEIEKEEDADREDYQDKLKRYKEACEMLEARENIEDAVETLEDLGDFEDSYEHLYEVAEEYQSYDYTEDAGNIYMYLADASYSDSDQQLFALADTDVQRNNIEHAKTLYQYLGSRTDANGATGEDGVSRCDYRTAYDLYNNREYEKAKTGFEALGEYTSPDYEYTAKEMVDACDLMIARKVIDDVNLEQYESAKEVLLVNEDYDYLKRLADNYYNKGMYTEAMEVYKLLDKQTSSSYESQIRDCETNQGVQEKYAEYNKEESKCYDTATGTMVNFVDMNTAESYLKNMYTTFATEDGDELDITKVELNGEKYGIKKITIDTKNNVIVTATIYMLSDESKKDITIKYESNVPYTYTNEYGNTYDKSVDRLAMEGKIYFRK